VHATHHSLSAQRNHEVTRSPSVHCALTARHVLYQPIHSHIKQEVNCLSIFTSVSRRIRYMYVIFAELHLYHSHFLHQSHISSHCVRWNLGCDRMHAYAVCWIIFAHCRQEWHKAKLAIWVLILCFRAS